MHFRAAGAHEAALDLSDLFNVFFLHASEVPKDIVLDSLYFMKIGESVQLRTVLAMYDQDIDRYRAMPGYLRLKSLVRRRIDQMIRTRIFKARN